jgi:hypothetical protein
VVKVEATVPLDAVKNEGKRLVVLARGAGACVWPPGRVL